MIFKESDIAYMVEYCQKVKAVLVIRREGDMYLVKSGPHSGLMIPHTRLFYSKKEAERQFIPLGKQQEIERKVVPTGKKEKGHLYPEGYIY